MPEPDWTEVRGMGLPGKGLLALGFAGTVLAGCAEAGEYCVSGAKSGTECSYLARERLEPGWRPSISAPPAPAPGALDAAQPPWLHG